MASFVRGHKPGPCIKYSYTPIIFAQIAHTLTRATNYLIIKQETDMKGFTLYILLLLNGHAMAYVSMDDDTLVIGEVATLIYVPGCGEWQNFSFAATNNQITATADAPDSWFSCHIDPAPPQYWNRIPLAQLPAGSYEMTITLNGSMQNINHQLSFVIGGSFQSVPMNGHGGLLILSMLLLVVGVINFKTTRI
jgi:hypothetical protein